jgi:hypothetical protein
VSGNASGYERTLSGQICRSPRKVRNEAPTPGAYQEDGKRRNLSSQASRLLSVAARWSVRSLPNHKGLSHHNGLVALADLKTPGVSLSRNQLQWLYTHHEVCIDLRPSRESRRSANFEYTAELKRLGN